MFGTRVSGCYFSSCICPSPAITSLMVLHRRQQLRVSVFLTSKPQTSGRALYISALYLLNRLPNLAASLYICSVCPLPPLLLQSLPEWFLSLKHFAYKKPICSISTNCLCSNDPFCGFGISILTLKPHLGFPFPQESSSQSLPMSDGQAHFSHLIPRLTSFTFSRFSEFSSSPLVQFFF